MLSKVYAVIRQVMYEGCDEPDSIWTIQELAEQRMNELLLKNTYADVTYVLYEYELNTHPI